MKSDRELRENFDTPIDIAALLSTINCVDAGLTNSAQGQGGWPSGFSSHQVRTGNRPKTAKALGGIGVARCVDE